MQAGLQLALAIPMDDAATLDNLFPRAALRPVLGALSQALGAGAPNELRGLYIWGPEGVGKSHLAQALCQRINGDVRYLPLAELAGFPSDAVLEGCAQADLVLFDDLALIASDGVWQESLFHLFNQRRAAGLPMVFTADRAPSGFGSMLPDLRSRLSALAVFHVPAASDDELIEILKFRAKQRGLTLSDDVCRYITSRAPRRIDALISLLDQLDEASLARGRAVTIPLITELKLLSTDR